MSIKNNNLRIRRQSAALHVFSCKAQRLNTENLIFAYLVGLIEGDGWFSFSKNGKYIIYEMGIELHIRDTLLLQKIKALLGIGNVVIYKKTNMVRYNVRKKQHLIDVIFPIFDKYPMLSDKAITYSKFKYIVNTKSIHYQSLENVMQSTTFNSYLNNCFEKHNLICLNLEKGIFPKYYSAWLVGFIEAEGCFSFYETITKSNPCYPVGSFDIGQKNAKILILSIRKFLNFKPQITEKANKFSFLKVSGVRSIFNIINFLEITQIKLLGYKKLQYLLWLTKLRKIKRYSKYVPKNY